MTSEARQLYLELALLSHGSVTAWSAGSGVPGSREPTGESRPPHELFAAEYERKGQTAVDKWRAFLERWRGHNTVKPAESSEDEWILQDGRGQAPDVVAQRFRCTPTRVRRVRVAAGLDAERGEQVMDRAKVALELHDGGLTQNDIANRLGISQPTVHRLLRTAKVRRVAA